MGLFFNKKKGRASLFGKILKTGARIAAPVIGTALAGPLGGGVGAFVQKAIGGISKSRISTSSLANAANAAVKRRIITPRSAAVSRASIPRPTKGKSPITRAASRFRVSRPAIKRPAARKPVFRPQVTPAKKVTSPRSFSSFTSSIKRVVSDVKAVLGRPKTTASKAPISAAAFSLAVKKSGILPGDLPKIPWPFPVPAPEPAPEPGRVGAWLKDNMGWALGSVGALIGIVLIVAFSNPVFGKKKTASRRKKPTSRRKPGSRSRATKKTGSRKTSSRKRTGRKLTKTELHAVRMKNLAKARAAQKRKRK